MSLFENTGFVTLVGLFMVMSHGILWAADAPGTGRPPYAAWDHGPGKDASYFPIAVWLQDPRLAPKYQAAGINLYIGLWKGPTAAQLATLKKHGMPVFCHQNEVGLRDQNNDIIVGWMHGDEPDNAHKFKTYWQGDIAKIKAAWPEVFKDLGDKYKGYGPPIPPKTIIAGYNAIKQKDPTRPVILNLGQGVAWDAWGGRGERTNHPEDYIEYAKGADIVSFDIYPVAHKHKDIRNKLWKVPYGVDRLRGCVKDKKPTWTCIETSKIKSDQMVTPQQMKAEVWMALVHGSKGLIYFSHEFKPKFNADALLDHDGIRQSVTAVNKQIHALAVVLNSPTIKDGAKVTSANPDIRVDIMVKASGGARYLFTVGMRDGKTTATFTLNGIAKTATVEVLGENRTITAKNGVFNDTFAPWDVHLYRVDTTGLQPSRKIGR